MGNLYHWHDERMVELKMRDINREIEQARLLKEAGISDTGWLARAWNAGLSLLVRRRKSTPAQHPTEARQEPSRVGKMAQ
jgi:hypothetical protein